MLLLRKYNLPLGIPLLLALLTGYLLGMTRTIPDARAQSFPSDGDEQLFRPFWQVWELVQDNYVAPDGNSPAPAALVDGAIRGMLRALGDEHSGYLDAQQFPVMQADWSGTIEGIGAVVKRDAHSGLLQIAWVLPDSPAAAAGLEAGDRFLTVDGLDVQEASQLELAALVRGPVGSDVRLSLRRGDAVLHFTITRARIEVPNLEWRLLEHPTLGYIRLQHFNGTARAALDDALLALNLEALEGLVLDLRGNPGGLLDSAVAVASAFVEQGPLLIQDFGEREHVLQADGSYVGATLPLVVLVDERSASAAELVAGALQDRGLATVIGQQTFGKGTMQNLFELDNGGGLQLTIANWLTPDGRWIHETGITPDLIVAHSVAEGEPAVDAPLEAAIEHLRSHIADVAA